MKSPTIKKQSPEKSFGQRIYQHLCMNGKQLLLLTSMVVVISFMVPVLLKFVLHNVEHTPVLIGVQILCFLLIGMAGVWIFHSSRFFASNQHLAVRTPYMIGTTLVVCILLYVLGSLLPVAGVATETAAAFVLPFLIYASWLSFQRIPARNYVPWYLPTPAERQLTIQPAGYSTATMQVQLKVARNPDAIQENIFPVTSPGKQKLGRLFEKFIEEQHSTGKQVVIAINNDPQASFAWLFFEEKWFGLYRRHLNPLRSLLENRIKPDTTIAVRRIQHQDSAA